MVSSCFPLGNPRVLYDNVVVQGIVRVQKMDTGSHSNHPPENLYDDLRET